jgi:hypothetical protein
VPDEQPPTSVEETTLALGRVALEHLQVRIPFGSIVVSNAALSGATARLSLESPNRLLGLTAESMTVDGADIVLPRWTMRDVGSLGPLRLEPLAKLDGAVRAYITDALWFVDAEIAVPIVDGRIDFNRVTVDHIGPNSTMGIDARGIYIEAPHRQRVRLLEFAPNLPGIANDAPRRRFFGRERGALDVRPFMEAALAADTSTPAAHFADRKLAEALQRTRLNADLTLGNGVLGTAAQHIVLATRGQERNLISISAARLEAGLSIAVPGLIASGGTFDFGDGVITTGALSAVLDVHVKSNDDTPGERSWRIALSISHIVARDVTLTPAAGAPSSGAG